ncbi:MAG: LamG domain-containing protein [Anaerohalosphaeraceae bacterium]
MKSFISFFLLSAVLVIPALAADTNWTGAAGDGLWVTPGNWSNGVPPSNPTVTGNINIGYIAASPVVTIRAQDNIVCGSTTVRPTDLHGPNWGATLNIDGGTLTHLGFVMAPVATSEAARSVINVRNGGRLSAVNLCLGDNWWFVAPYVTMNVYENSTVTVSDYLWLGGYLNLYSGTIDISNGMNMAANTASYGVTCLDIWDGTLILRGQDQSANIPTWIANGYLKAYGTTPGSRGGGTIVVDTQTIPGGMILTAIPPLCARDPNPLPQNADGSVGTLINPTQTQVQLNWKAGVDPNNFYPVNPKIRTHYIWMGESETSLSYVGQVPHTDWNNPNVSYTITLAEGRTYYWSIEEGLDNGTGNAYPSGDPNNILGPIWSFTAKGATPLILVDPVNTVASPNAVLSIVANDVASTYQWFKVGTPDIPLTDNSVYSGTTTTTLTITAPTVAHEGQYYCIAYNGLTPSAPSKAAWVWTKRLMGHWKFDGNLLDSVSASVPGAPAHHGTMAGGGTGVDTYGAGINGNAIVFANTADYVEIDNPEFFNFYPLGFTISFWYKENSAVGWRLPVSKLDAGTAGWLFGVDKAWRNQAVFFFDSNNNPAFWADGNPNVALDDGQWHMITAVYDPQTTSYTIYTDGDKNETIVLDISAAPLAAAPLSIGGRATELSVDGAIDDVRIYSYPLTPVQIAQLYVDFEPSKFVCMEDEEDPLTAFDLNSDCKVDLADFALFAAKWLQCQRYPQSACD